jgi:hypothetical protein
MKVELKKWVGLGLATALSGAGLAGCSGEGGESGESAGPAQASQTSVAGAGEGGEAGEGESGDTSALSVEQRLVFMAGHVEAGLALYRAGESEMAARHLMHPVSETHASERAGLAELGFDPAPFEAVSKALAAGKPASGIEPQLAAAEANLAAMREAAGGDPAAQIRFLMETAVAEYTIAVHAGTVTDAAEYQDAWGFVMVARKLAGSLTGPKAATVQGSLDQMIGLWPDGAPIAPESPAPAGQISALASRVMLDLPK